MKLDKKTTLLGRAKNLYDVARNVSHDFGMPWTDPRTGITYQPPAERRRKIHPTDEHQARHRILHEMVDELVADYLLQHREALPSETTLLDLMKWSYEQTQNPTDPPT